MKKLVTVAVLFLAGSLVAASTAFADDTPCVGILIGTFDNVVVPPGARCAIANSVVTGNVTALEGSQLVIQSSNVRGNVDGDKADLVQVRSSIVRGSITIKEGGPASFPLPAGAQACLAPTNPCEVFVFLTTVEEGNVQIEKMTGDIAVSNSSVQSGTVKVEDNFVPVDNLFSLTTNQIANNLQVFKNKGPATFKQVIRNTVGDTIQCFENDPPFIGGPNTAPKMEGQCF